MKSIQIASWLICVLFAMAVCGGRSFGETEFSGLPYKGDDLFADTWVATDGLGRLVSGAQQCGPPKQDKWVGIFYWTWHTGLQNGADADPNDNTKILAAAQGGQVQWPKLGRTHYWGEPELGYYRMTDPFVIRKHASMLADAGIDVILFDTTNGAITFREQYEALCREYSAMRKEGVRTPAIAVITPFMDPRPVLDRLWREFYHPRKWKDLWFHWEGKPLVLADKEYIQDEEIRSFFTFRRPMPDYWIGPSGPDQWSWLEVYPQHLFRNSKDDTEQMSVGVAMNAIPNTPGPAPMSHSVGAMGRSWHDERKDDQTNAVNWGMNFTEQWARAVREPGVQGDITSTRVVYKRRSPKPYVRYVSENESHFATLVRYTFARIGFRPSHRARIAWSQRCVDDHDLYACFATRCLWCAESA